MSSTTGRAIAAIVTAIIAVLTGVAVGLVSPHRSCTVIVSTPVPITTSAAPATPTGRASSASDAQSSDAQSTEGSTGAAQPAPAAPPAGQTTQKTVRAQLPDCVPTRFERRPGLLALLGVLAAGLAALGLWVVAGVVRQPAHQPVPRRAGTPPPATPLTPPTALTPPTVAPRVVPPTVRGGAEAAVEAARLAEADRSALVAACIFVRDRTTSKALAERLGAALSQVGVVTVEPAGARFDPALHEAGGATPSNDPTKVGTIAAVEVPGYADRGHPLRAPVVTVYQGTDANRNREQT